MSRKQRKTVSLELRKPTSQATAEALDTFVGGQVPRNPDVQTPKLVEWAAPAAEWAPAASSSSSSTGGRGVVERADGRRLRRRTVYLPYELDAELRAYCARLELDVSEVLAQAAASYLEATKA